MQTEEREREIRNTTFTLVKKGHFKGTVSRGHGYHKDAHEYQYKRILNPSTGWPLTKHGYPQDVYEYQYTEYRRTKHNIHKMFMNTSTGWPSTDIHKTFMNTSTGGLSTNIHKTFMNTSTLVDLQWYPLTGRCLWIPELRLTEQLVTQQWVHEMAKNFGFIKTRGSLPSLGLLRHKRRGVIKRGRGGREKGSIGWEWSYNLDANFMTHGPN